MATPPRHNNPQPSSPGNPQFVQFLQGLFNHDNAVRQQAETQYNQLQATNPTLLITNLLEQLRGSPDATLREFSAVLLRGLVGFRGDAYHKLDATTQHTLRTMLLHVALETANQRSLSKKICDTIGTTVGVIFNIKIVVLY